MPARTLLSAAAAAVIACTLSIPPAAADTLYDRLGGYNAIQAVVDQMIANVAADRRINKFFAHADIRTCGAASPIRSAWRPAAGASTQART